MLDFLKEGLSSPVVLVLTIGYLITSSITTFDIRMTQGRKNGTLPANEPMLPNWVAYIFWIDWIIIIALAFINWKFAIAIFIIRFILKVLPVLEILGNFLMAPFKKK
ncbi:MAG TPA: hypothetical protein PKV49_01025 [bacterium]|jgi:hypothetical protein|nr:hypothetical protein [bacterium]HPL22234.1 hypothetical protein [bacterium]